MASVSPVPDVLGLPGDAAHPKRRYGGQVDPASRPGCATQNKWLSRSGSGDDVTCSNTGSRSTSNAYVTGRSSHHAAVFRGHDRWTS